MKFLVSQFINFPLLVLQETNPIAEWFSLDKDTWLYIVLIIVFLVFFVWNSSRLKKDRNRRSNQNFRKRYYERKQQENNE
jgi:preprotein translocase subunit SecY